MYFLQTPPGLRSEVISGRNTGGGGCSSAGKLIGTRPWTQDSSFVVVRIFQTNMFKYEDILYAFLRIWTNLNICLYADAHTRIHRNIFMPRNTHIHTRACYVFNKLSREKRVNSELNLPLISRHSQNPRLSTTEFFHRPHALSTFTVFHTHCHSYPAVSMPSSFQVFLWSLCCFNSTYIHSILGLKQMLFMSCLCLLALCSFH